MLRPEPLHATNFAPFGDVISTDARSPLRINDGTTRRYDRLADVRTAANTQGAGISLFVADRRELPMPIVMLERHPLGSQAFMPLSGHAYLVVVAESHGDTPGPVRAFHARADQGVCFAPGTWHHPLIALADDSRFLVVDAITDLANCETTTVAREMLDLR